MATTTTKKGTKSTSSTTKTAAAAPQAPSAETAALNEQIELLKQMLAATQAQLAEAKAVNAAAQPQVTITAPSTDVAVVYCSESLGCAKISNMELNFTRYGEEFLLPRAQFDELVGKYRSWFDRGVLAVSSKYADIAAAKQLPIDKGACCHTPS